MIVKLTRILTILPVVLLFFVCKSLATTFYVNVNNPTPGTGSSWATAFNDLQSALAVSSVFDRIWVAQGTYKPSSPAGRSATFKINAGFVLGGFNGTETAEPQRNPTLYPTILSGDIGVPGSMADNCYHVVTVTSQTNWPTLDGITVRDGQADAGYPGSTVAVADNTGGGVLVVAHTGEMSFFTMTNCIFTNNFAVYGGGVGGFGDGDQTNFGGTQCTFSGNQAIYGGAMANIASNSDWSLLNFSSCMFINNTAAASNASVVYQSITTNTNSCQFNLQNCLFYNETAPMFTSLTDGPHYWFDVMNCIIWTSGAAYSGGYANGNSSISFDNCDVDGPVPNSSSINSDPLFVNAAGGDFHVSPCSPVVDAGFPWTFPGSTKDFGGADRYQGTAVDIGPYEQVKGTVSTAPTVNSPVPYCQNGVASPLTATVAAGASVLWYTAASGGTGNAVAPTPSTASIGSTTYYVTQTTASNCESSRTPIVVNISTGTTAPTAGVVAPYCQFGVASPLTATAASGASLLWYTAASGGTGNAVAPTPSTANVGTTDYYVSQIIGTCESPRTTVPVTINAGAAAPTAGVVAPYCQFGVASPLTATAASGASLLWYTAASGGTGNAVAPTPSTASVGTTDYYVSQIIGTCESPRTSVPVTIKAGAVAPTAAAAPIYCQNVVALPLTATASSGASLLWYTAAAGGTGSSVPPIPSTASVGTTDYYVSQIIGTCESPRTTVPVTIKTGSAAPTAASPSYCLGDVASVLTATGASGASFLWYNALTGGTGSPIAPTPSTASVGMVSYYVTQTLAGGCESSRKEVDVTIKPPPKVGIAPITTSLCAGNVIALEAYGATTYQWSPATGLSNSGIADPELRLQNNIQYTVTGTDANGCTASAEVVLDINPNCLLYSVPDAFSPNGDGKNDVFRVKTGDDPKSFSLIVFNRFGGKVFESSNVGIGWDGMIGGNSAPTGTYVYVLQATMSTGVVVKRQGTIVLVR